MTAYGERIFSGPYRLDNFEAGILPVRVNSYQTAPGPQCPGQRGNDAFGPEIDRGFGTVGLGSDDQVEIGLGTARVRNDRIEQETVVFPIQHDGHWTLIDRHP